MPLTDEQRSAVAKIRAIIENTTFLTGTAGSVEQRARYPDPAHIPTDVTIRVEIAPPSTQPHPLFDSSVLKTPERVPVYFYALHNEQAEIDAVDTHVIFFIHGGGNITGHPTHEPFTRLYIQLLRAASAHSGVARKCVLIAPSYRLATVPENTFPAALQDLVAAYDYVLGKGYNPSNIVIAGDSAGGKHAIVLTHLILQSGGASPRGVIPIAPSAILVYDQLSERARANADTDVLTIPGLETWSRTYLGDTGVAHTDPLVSGAFIPFSASWPKTLILVGSGDIFIDVARELEKRLAASNLEVELVEYEDRTHGWWVYSDIFPGDDQDAAQRIARFVFSS